MNFDRTMRTIQQAVVDAGGEWIGVQDAFPGDLLALPKIVFRHPVTKKTILLSFNPVLVEYSDLLNDIRVALGQKIDPKFDTPPLIDSPFAEWFADLHRVAQKIAAYSENRLSEQEKKKS